MLDDFSHVPVTGKENLHPWWWLLTIEVGVMISIPLLVIGGPLAYALPFKQLLEALAVSGVILAFLSAVACVVGTETRLTTLLISERVLGRLPARALSAIILFVFLGWWGFQTEIMAQVFDGIARSAGWELPRALMITVCGLIMISTSVIGSRAIGKVAYVLVPIKVVVLMVILAYGKRSLGLSDIISFAPPPGMTFGGVVAMVTGLPMVAVLTYPDLSRFIDTRAGAIKAGIGMYAGFITMLALGAGLSIAYQTHNIIEILPTLGYAPLAVVIVFFATWAANDKNLYSACIGISAFTRVLERWQITGLAGLVGIGLAYLGVFSHLVASLTLMGVVMMPVAAIYMVDYFNRPAAYKGPQPKALVRWLPTTAWILGALIGLLTTPVDGFGFGAFSLSTVPGLDAFVATLLVMLAGVIFTRR